MMNRKVDQVLAQIPYLDQAGKEAARALHKAVLDGGEETRNVADILHGTWLGHPLHPVLTDLTVGAWVLGSTADLLTLFSRSKELERAADGLTMVGTVSAIPTAVSGATDYSTIPQPAAGTGLAHAFLNTLALILYALSLRARRNQRRGAARLTSLLGLTIASISAYLGGHLVYDKKVGVKHGGTATEPTTWTRVMAASELGEGEPKRVETGDKPVLLYRTNGQILAVGAVCPHAGGPLEKGEFRGTQVQCPWHDSVFELKDGCIVHGPAAYALARYQARVRDGQVEVRLVEAA